MTWYLKPTYEGLKAVSTCPETIIWGYLKPTYEGLKGYICLSVPYTSFNLKPTYEGLKVQLLQQEAELAGEFKAYL